MESNLQAMTTKSNASCKYSGYNTPNGYMVYIKIKKGLRPQKKNYRSAMKKVGQSYREGMI